MKRNGATLLELIFVLIIISFLSTATFKGIEAILIRSYKAKEITKLSLDSQIVVNQISNYLSYRVPYSVIGYNAKSGNFKYIGDITDDNLSILEWFGTAHEAFVDGNYSGFADMATDSNNSFISQGTHGSDLNTTTQNKFHTSDDIYSKHLVNLIFSGSFDRATSDSNDYNSSFGWHGNESNDSFDISITDDNITVTDATKPKFIYAKYFITDSAYAIARGVDVNQSANCIKNLHIKSKDMNNTLFLFSNYRPWHKGETFCADKSGTQEGNVSILMQNIDGFNFQEIDYTIRIYLDINKSIRGASPIHFSKMKVVF